MYYKVQEMIATKHQQHLMFVWSGNEATTTRIKGKILGDLSKLFSLDQRMYLMLSAPHVPELPVHSPKRAATSMIVR